MADSNREPIQQVQVGDQVLSRDPATGKDEAKMVTFTIERHAPAVVDVTLHDARTGKTETLTCTRLLFLMLEARRRCLSGVSLKEQANAAAFEEVSALEASALEVSARAAASLGPVAPQRACAALMAV